MAIKFLKSQFHYDLQAGHAKSLMIWLLIKMIYFKDIQQIQRKMSPNLVISRRVNCKIETQGPIMKKKIVFSDDKKKLNITH